MHGSLKEAFLKRILIVGGKMDIHDPISCEWNLTFKCNLKCSFCSLRCSPQIEENNLWNNDNINRIVSELKKNNVIYISLSGGEPLMSKAILKIVNILYKNHFIVTLASNGLLINEKFLDEVKGKIKWVQLSLQSLNSDYNVEKMGATSEDILDAINRVTKAGIGLSVATINFKEEEQELLELKNFFEERNIKHYIRSLIQPGALFRQKMGYKKVNECIPYFCILPNGNVAQCAELGIVAGNILEEDLTEILKKDELRYCDPAKGCLLVEGLYENGTV